MRARLLLLASAALVVGCDDSSPPLYDDTELAYFEDIAFGTEFGEPWDTVALRKFDRDIVIRVEGFPSERQMATVLEVAGELAELVGGIDVRVLPRGTAAGGNLGIYFVTHDSMVSAVGEWAASNHAVFRIWRDGGFAIDSSQAWIAYDRGSAEALDHAVREELTQALGLGQDSWLYPESIFYQGSSAVTEYAPIDRSVIRMLYDRRIDAGMNRTEARAILGGE